MGRLSRTDSARAFNRLDLMTVFFAIDPDAIAVGDRGLEYAMLPGYAPKTSQSLNDMSVIERSNSRRYLKVGMGEVL